MLTKAFTLSNPNGLHARPAAELLKIAQAHSCRLLAYTDQGWVDAGMMNLMLLVANQGVTLQLGVEGSDEASCLAGITKSLEKII